MFSRPFLVRALLIYWLAFCGIAPWLARPAEGAGNLDHPYPWGSVLAVCAVLAFETAILYQAVAPRTGETWKKRVGLVALFVASLAILASTVFKPESPPCFYAYALYAAVTLIGLAAWGGFLGVKQLRSSG